MVVSMVVGEGAGIGLCVFRISYLIRVLGFVLVLFKFSRCVFYRVTSLCLCTFCIRIRLVFSGGVFNEV